MEPTDAELRALLAQLALVRPTVRRLLSRAEHAMTTAQCSASERAFLPMLHMLHLLTSGVPRRGASTHCLTLTGRRLLGMMTTQEGTDG